MSYRYPAVGAHLHDDTATFTVWAPLHKNVKLHLNDLQTPMTSDERGYWSVAKKNVQQGDRYSFVLDDGEKYPDPASRWQPDGVHGASAVMPNSFNWTDHNWSGIPLEDMVIYELHVGTFTNAGTFDGIVSKLDYLRDLEVNAIEIMPIAQFPGERNWGYDGVYPYAVQHSYGGVEGLKRLVNEAHRREIAVILDVVYNHQGPEGNYLPNFAPYFTEKYKTFWGSAINFDDAWCDGVRQFYIGNALQWLDEFHIDGLRMDAVHAIWDFGARHFIEELREQVHHLEARDRRKKVLIAELDLNNPRYVYPSEIGGYGMDGQWIDEFHHALHALATEEVDGYYEDFGSTSHLVKSIQDSYVYTGEYSIHRKKHFGIKPAFAHYGQFVVFAQNHDQIGNRLLGDRLTKTLSFEKLKLVAATYLLSPHVPMLFMGEEFGEKNPFQYFISHSDATLIENVRKGRREEFKYFNWSGEIPDPQAEATFQQCILSWNTTGEAGVMLEFYKTLISLRKDHSAMRSRLRADLNIIDTQFDRVIAFERKNDGRHIVVLLNFNATKITVTLPLVYSLKRILDSSDLQWNGPGAVSPEFINHQDSIILNPHTAVVFEML